MLDELTGDDLYAELIMLRTNDSRYFIVVEGVADVAVFDRFMDLDHCIPIPAHGKGNAHICLERVIRDDFSGVFAILDKDWFELLPGDLEDKRIIYTDHYDLDACIFFSDGIYEGIAGSFCAGSGFRHGTPGCTSDDLQRACIEIAFPLGALRYLSERDGLGLNLSNFPLGEVMNSDLSVNLTSLVSIALARTKGNNISTHGVEDALRQEMKTVRSRIRYCSGHDLAKAFSILVKQRWKRKIGADVVERSARAALSAVEIKKWMMYRHAKKWIMGTPRKVWRV
ncbi:hypothetical protein ACFV6E_10430 [Streptomyces sp. NPDC059785]|uniref:hypothetical protein n=1 Tax=Streptomyces sp. NPDC059785 TaxID=3346945 RepID=UPI003650274F